MTNCSTNVCGTGSWSGPKPGDPDNSSVLTAVSEFGGIRLKWTMPNLNPFAVAHTRILRNTTANLSSATELAVYSGNVYFDATAAVDPIVTYYYWIQHVSINGTDLETLGPASGTAKPGIDEVIAKLANKIEFNSLASSLRSRVERITDLENGITQINQSIANDNQILSWELQAIKNDLTQAVAYVNNQLNIAADERVALVESINTLLAGFGDANTVALREESRVRAEETGALFAEKIVKADLAGNVVGYGLSAYKDPSGNFSSDFRVAADTFSVAPPAIVQDTAPSSDNYNGKVWVDTSNASGPVPKWYNISTKAWQTTPVKASTPFYIQTTSRTINGEDIPAGVYIDSAYISQLKANQIDTRGLTIRDNEGNIVFSAGTALDWNKVGGDGKPENGATRNVYVGDWSSTSVGYSIGDVVIESGYGWICVKNHISSTATKPPVYPNTNEYWKVHTIKGADGVSGNYTDYVFIRSANVPQTPTATTGTPAGWFDTPPTTGDGLLYMSKATKKADGTVVGSWTAPVRLDGSIGADGKYTKYQYAVSATTPDANTTWSDSATTPGSGSFLWMRSGVVTPPATAPTSWDTAVRISGEKGDQGQQGIQGPTGPTGPTGSRGPAFATSTEASPSDSAFTAASGLSSAMNGDQLFLTTKAKIYTRTDGSWGETSVLVVNGDAIVNGTIAAARINAAGLQVGSGGLIEATGYPGYSLGGAAPGDSNAGGARFAINSSGYVHTDTLVNWGQIFTLSLGAKGSVGSAVVYGQNDSSGPGIQGKSTSGAGGQFAGNATRGAIMLENMASVPSDATKGQLCCVNGDLMFSNGTTWRYVRMA